MLKKTLYLMVVLMVAALALNLSAQETMKKTGGKSAKSTGQSKMKQKTLPAKKNAYTPDEMRWSGGPPFIPAGAKMAVLDGNPMSNGIYTLRLKLPDGYKVAPHWHPKREEVTVISGTLDVGMGDKFDGSKMKSFPAGSFAYLDPDMHHYVETKGATEIQIHGRGPVKFNYIDPNDDPSKKK